MIFIGLLVLRPRSMIFRVRRWSGWSALICPCQTAPVSASGLYARIAPRELDAVLKDPQLEVELEQTMFETDDYEYWFVDAAWDGIRYLLTMAGAPVDVVRGGTAISGFEWTNDGPARYFTVEQVKEATAYFQATPWERLAGHYDPAAMTAADVYPAGWDRAGKAEDNLHWLKVSIEGLAEFFAAAASAGDAIITIIG